CDERVIIGPSRGRSVKQLRRLAEVIKRLSCERVYRAREQRAEITVDDLGGSPGSKGGRPAPGNRAQLRQQVLEPGLRRDCACRHTGPELCGQRVEGLGERLSRFQILEHIRYLIQIDALVQVAPQPCNVTELKHHLATKGSLNGKVDRVI